MQTDTEQRLFFALWPDEHIRQQCAAILTQLPAKVGTVQAVQNIHVTLVFLGNVSASTSLRLQLAVSTLRIPEISLCFDQLSYWPQSGILCLTARQKNHELRELVQQLNALTSDVGIASDSRPYQPHITLLRQARQAVNLHIEPIIWRAQSIALVESCRLPQGVEYRLRRTWP